MELEKEFAEVALMHKMSILSKKISDYIYTNAMVINENLPDCVVLAESKMTARKIVRNLYLTSEKRFNELYELAYEDMKGALQ